MRDLFDRYARFFQLLFLLCFLTSMVQAQSGNGRQITSSVIAGGGGTSGAAGSTQVDGTIGQSITATSSGGSYSLQSGFWSNATALTTAALSLSDVTGIYGETISLSATLSANGANLSGQLITFALNGATVGTASTDTNGLATLSNVGLLGLSAGAYPGAVTAQWAGDATFAASNGAAQLTLQKATPVLQVTGGTFIFNNHAQPAAVSATGIDNEALSPITVLYNGSSSLPANAGTYLVTATFAGNQNYNSVINNQQSIVINQASQTINFGPLSAKTYGDAPFTVGAAGGASGNPVNFSSQTLTVCTVGGVTVTIVSAGTCTVRASQTGNTNYNSAPDVDRSFTVNKAKATVTLSNLSQTYDGTAKNPTATANPAGKMVVISYSLGGSVVAVPTDAGSYDVAAIINDANLEGATTGTLVIGKANQSITVGTHAPANAIYHTSFTVAATSNSGLAVSYSSSGECTKVGATFTVSSGTGSCTVQYDQAGDSNYNVAAPVRELVTARKADQTITFAALADKTEIDPDFTVNATASSTLGVSFAAVGQCTVSGSTVHLTGAGSCTISASQGGDSNYNAATAVAGTFKVTEVNESPTAVNDTLSNVAEDSGQRVIPFTDLIGNDSKGPADETAQTLIVKTVSNPVGGTVSISGSKVLFTLAADYNGPASFQYTVEDNGITNGMADPKTSAPATVSFAITEVNDVPDVVNDTLTSIAEDAKPRAIAFADLTGNDSKGATSERGQTLMVVTATNAIGGTVVLVPGYVVFTPMADYNGPASFEYTATDNGTTNGVPEPKSSATAVVEFNITEVNDFPTAVADTLPSVTQDSGERSIDFSILTANDSRGPANENNQTLIVKTVSNPVGVTVSIVEGTVRVSPMADYHGTASFQYTVEDDGTTNGFVEQRASGPVVVQFDITAPVEALAAIRFSEAKYSVAESAGWKTITVERTGDTSQAERVDYASSDHSNPANFLPCTSPGAGFASSRCDFTTAVGTLRFAAGETSKTFDVLINQDNEVEGPETLELTLSTPTGEAAFGLPATAILEITDDATEPATNSVETSSEFVRSQYHDFLHREPDAPGLAFWTDNIEKCNAPARRPMDQTAAQCIDKQRESTAVAFFSSPEFQMTGGFVYRLYKGSLSGAPNYDGGSPGRFPTSLEFMRDVSQVSEGILVNNQISGAVVEANRNRLAAEFVQRPEFLAKYGGLNDTLYVEELFTTAGIVATEGEKHTLIDGLNDGTETRASVLRRVVDGTIVIDESNVQFTTNYGQAFYEQEQQRVFVFMEYVGYLRRNPDAAGYVFWLGKLNHFQGDPFQAEMVRSFILAPEYRNRFGQ